MYSTYVYLKCLSLRHCLQCFETVVKTDPVSVLKPLGVDITPYIGGYNRQDCSGVVYDITRQTIGGQRGNLFKLLRDLKPEDVIYILSAAQVFASISEFCDCLTVLEKKHVHMYAVEDKFANDMLRNGVTGAIPTLMAIFKSLRENEKNLENSIVATDFPEAMHSLYSKMETGILSVQEAANMAGVSVPTMRKLRDLYIGQGSIMCRGN